MQLALIGAGAQENMWDRLDVRLHKGPRLKRIHLLRGKHGIVSFPNGLFPIGHEEAHAF